MGPTGPARLLPGPSRLLCETEVSQQIVCHLQSGEVGWGGSQRREEKAVVIDACSPSRADHGASGVWVANQVAAAQSQRLTKSRCPRPRAWPSGIRLPGAGPRPPALVKRTSSVKDASVRRSVRHYAPARGGARGLSAVPVYLLVLSVFGCVSERGLAASCDHFYI